MSSDEIVIRVEKLSKCYHIYDRPQDRLKQSLLPRFKMLIGHPFKAYYREFWALQEISFELKKGDTVGIIGRNGSGKSTLLQLVAGTLKPTTGSVHLSGRVAALLELGSGFNPEFTGRENVYLNASILGLKKDEIDKRFDDIAAFADIGEFIEQPVKTYSSGMVVRLAFSVSVNVDADLLIIDEALSVGDAAFQFKCLDRLNRLTKSGTTLLFVSQDMGTVKNFCNYAIYLQGGKERARGNPEEITELYFLDMRDEQRRWLSPASDRIVAKNFLGGSKGIAFGTRQGRIVSANIGEGGFFSTFSNGDIVLISVAVEYESSLAWPTLSVLIQDRRLMDIGGQFFQISPDRQENGWCQASLSIEFKAKFRPGRYFITVRLENRSSERQFLPIDKQVGLLSFEIFGPEKAFLGVVDLELKKLRIDNNA